MVRPELRESKSWIAALGVQGHSEDETDREHTTPEGRPRYTIMKLEWRADMVTKYVRAMDVVHLSTRWTRGGRPRKGQFPRIRVAARNKVDTDAQAVPGLPRNFYDSNWLDALSEEERASLQILDVDVDLSIPDAIQR